MDAIYFDTETTGIDNNAEIIQFGIVNSRGEVLLDTLIQCEGEISAEAQAVHGITKEHLKTAPTWPDVHNAICEALANADIIKAYNIQFDLKMLRQTAKKHNLKAPNFKKQRCVMKDYAKRFADSGRWVKLTEACKQQNINISDIKAHNAAGDCEMTRRLDIEMHYLKPIKSRSAEFYKKTDIITIIMRSIILGAVVYLCYWLYIIFNA